MKSGLKLISWCHKPRIRSSVHAARVKSIPWIVTFPLVSLLVAASVQELLSFGQIFDCPGHVFHCFSINGWTTKDSQSSFCLSQRSKEVILRHSFPLEHVRKTAWRRPKADKASLCKLLSKRSPSVALRCGCCTYRTEGCWGIVSGYYPAELLWR